MELAKISMQPESNGTVSPQEGKIVKKDRNYITLAPLRRLMKGEGADLVSEEATKLLRDMLLKSAKDITYKAVELMKSDNRKRVSGLDIEEATKSIKK